MNKAMMADIIGGFRRPTVPALFENAYMVTGGGAAGPVRIPTPFGQNPFRNVFDHLGLCPEIERYTDVPADMTRNVMTNFGSEETLKRNT